MQELDPNWSLYSPMVSSIIQAGEYLGAPVGALLIKVGIDKHLLKDPEHRFAVSQVFQLCELVADYSQAPDLGLYAGRISYVDGLHLQLYMSTVCTTFRQYLNLIPSMQRITGDVGEVRMQADKQFLKLQWHPLWQPSAQQRFLSDSVLTSSAAIVNSLCLLPVPVQQAHFSYSEPQDLTLLRTTFGDKLYFDQPVSCLYFARDSLDYPLTRPYDGMTSTLASLSVDHLFSEGEPPDVFLNQLRQTLFQFLPQVGGNIDRVAKALNLSRRTLQRRLSERDTQFQKVLQQVRADLALRYLADERLTVTEIAFLLGYSDQGSFSAAFKACMACHLSSIASADSSPSTGLPTLAAPRYWAIGTKSHANGTH
ncbi:MAG: AraC family transcriptional regulator ligand-binding domain-containing protein [Arenicella sp.]|nr:AraC family transcriptional regulator ligand-binding domain-containing protein [Arenicella sp.]